MSAVEVKELVSPVELGEGPHWVEGQQALLFVDIWKGDVHRYFPDSKRHQILHVEGVESGVSVSLVIPVEGASDLFIVGLGRSLAVVEWALSDPDQHTVKAKAILHTVDDHKPTNRFNDGKCDPQGRLWAGTMPLGFGPGEMKLQEGALFCLNSNLNLTQKLDKVSIANGLAWSHDKKTFYYIDSLTFSVEAFDYDDASSQISNRRTVLDYRAAGLEKDVPDGMCIDAAGNLWVANFHGAKVVCIDPTEGKIVRTVELPAQNMTSVCWGGRDYSTLFATSAQTSLSPEELAGQPAAGTTFAITGLGVKGLPPVNFKATQDFIDKYTSH